MIEGVEILNKTKIMDSPNWVPPVIICLIIIALIVFCCELLLDDHFILSVIFGIIGIIAICGMVALCIVNPKIHTGRYSYECIIEDSVSLNTISDTYEIVEQRGKIWILEDKEAVND